MDKAPSDGQQSSGAFPPPSFDLPPGRDNPDGLPPAGQGTTGQGPSGQSMPGQGSGGPPADPPDDRSDEPAQPAPRRRPAWLLPTAVALCAVIVAAVLVVAITKSRNDDEQVMTVELVEADDPGRAPFTKNVATVKRADITYLSDKSEAPPTSTSSTDGDTLAVKKVDVSKTTAYGSHTEAVCDREALTEALDEDEAARAAWTALMGIEGDEVDATVADLTPLVLTRDTAVSNSRFADGEGEWFASVLEAGTPVLVDSAGTPRIKCSCGNPLKPADLDTKARVTGTRWDTFSPDNVVSLQPTKAGNGATIPTVDITTGQTVPLDLGSRQTEPDPAPEPELATDSRLSWTSEGLMGLPWGTDRDVVVTRLTELFGRSADYQYDDVGESCGPITGSIIGWEDPFISVSFDTNLRFGGSSFALSVIPHERGVLSSGDSFEHLQSIENTASWDGPFPEPGMDAGEYYDWNVENGDVYVRGTLSAPPPGGVLQDYVHLSSSFDPFSCGE